MSRFVTQDRVKITVSSMPGSWDSRSGAEAERENVKLRPGAGEPKQVVHTQLEYGDITVTRLFDAVLIMDEEGRPAIKVYRIIQR